MVKLPPLEALYRHLEAAYPDEGCAVIVDGPNGPRVELMDNVYDRYHRVDPEAFPRTARSAYLMDPRAFLKLATALERTAERVAVIVHSHADVGAYFSDEDRAQAAPLGQPLLPGTDYLVVAVDQGRVAGAKLFRFERGAYTEIDVPV